MTLENSLTRKLGIQYPIIGGPMYPCSNPELVAAISQAGGIGVVQPLSLTYVYGYQYKEGLRYIRSLTNKPIGMNALIEASSKIYMERMNRFVEESLEEGVRFFVTSLGNPSWVVKKVHAVGGLVFHDVTERKWALKAKDAGVDGLICVNNLAGGHSGSKSPQELIESLRDLDLPLVCAGGVGSKQEFRLMLDMGYQAVQFGTRFIASTECKASDEYKQAIINAKKEDIVHTEKITGVDVAVINTPSVQKLGLKANLLTRYLLKHKKAKHWMRLYYSLMSFFKLKRSMKNPSPYRDYWQAGKSVESIHQIQNVGEIISQLVK